MEAVEHLEPSEYQCADAEKKIFSLLDVGFPTKDSAEELSENMTKLEPMRVSL